MLFGTTGREVRSDRAGPCTGRWLPRQVAPVFTGTALAAQSVCNLTPVAPLASPDVIRLGPGSHREGPCLAFLQPCPPFKGFWQPRSVDAELVPRPCSRAHSGYLEPCNPEEMTQSLGPLLWGVRRRTPRCERWPRGGGLGLAVHLCLQSPWGCG